VNRNEKTEVVSELEQKLKTAKVALLTRYDRLTVAQVDRLRREVRAASGECRVAKNTLAKRAVASTPYSAAEKWLEGPTAFVLGYEDPIALTKVIAKWAETETEKFVIKGGLFEGEVLEAKSVVELSKTPSKEVLRAKLLGTLQAPAAKFVRLLAEPASQLARLLNARKESLPEERS
jgi:large subunit ribosomal protein L10